MSKRKRHGMDHIFQEEEVWLFIQYYDEVLSPVLRASTCEDLNGMLISSLVDIPNGLSCLAPWKKEMVEGKVQFSSTDKELVIKKRIVMEKTLKPKKKTDEEQKRKPKPKNKNEEGNKRNPKRKNERTGDSPPNEKAVKLSMKDIKEAKSKEAHARAATEHQRTLNMIMKLPGGVTNNTGSHPPPGMDINNTGSLPPPGMVTNNTGSHPPPGMVTNNTGSHPPPPGMASTASFSLLDMDTKPVIPFPVKSSFCHDSAFSLFRPYAKESTSPSQTTRSNISLPWELSTVNDYTHKEIETLVNNNNNNNDSGYFSFTKELYSDCTECVLKETQLQTAQQRVTQLETEVYHLRNQIDERKKTPKTASDSETHNIQPTEKNWRLRQEHLGASGAHSLSIRQ